MDRLLIGRKLEELFKALEFGGYCAVISVGDLRKNCCFFLKIFYLSMNSYLIGSSRTGIPLDGARKFELGYDNEEFTAGATVLTGTSGNADVEAAGIGANRTARKFLGCTRLERESPGF